MVARGTVTLTLLSLAFAVDRGDAASLPAIFLALQTNLGLSPSQLSLLSLCQGLATAFSGPLWGLIVDRAHTSRPGLLALGCLLWGALTALSAMTSSFRVLLLLRFLIGGALACISPIRMSLVAELTPPSRRGITFGITSLFGILGAALGGIFSTTYSAKSLVLGLQGWRFVCVAIGALSWLVAVLVAFFAHDPRDTRRHHDHGATCTMVNRSRLDSSAPHAPSSVSCMEALRHLRRLRTLHYIILQGVVGGVPWNALSFLAMWLQLTGLSAWATSIVVACQLLGEALGQPLGGALGDAAAAWDPDEGRALVAQLTTAAGIPLVPLVLLVLPTGPTHGTLLGGAMFVFGLVMSWGGTAANFPISSEVVPSHSLATVTACAGVLQASSSSLFGAPMVAFLSEHYFGYTTPPAHMPLDAIDPEERAQNAEALSRAMVAMSVPPWLVCIWFWRQVGKVYPRDRDVTRSAIEAERAHQPTSAPPPPPRKLLL